VAVIAGQEKPSSDGSTFSVSVVVEVIVLVAISVVVSVPAGVHDSCRRCRAGRGSSRRFRMGLLPVLVAVVLGGIYESEQSVSSSRVALTLLVTVIGGQLNPDSDSDPASEVSYTVTTLKVIESVVMVVVSVGIGQAEQLPSDAQYAMSLQHSLVQQLSESGHDPFSQHCSEVRS
jgi:uncharacterized membrane protein YbjE (DUF340 family)